DCLSIRREQCAKAGSRKSRWSRLSGRRIAIKFRGPRGWVAGQTYPPQIDSRSVPTGYSEFPHEILRPPRSTMAGPIADLVNLLCELSRAGFAALQHERDRGADRNPSDDRPPNVELF